MNKISVAIPTYYSSKFIKDTITPFLKHKIVDEIIITDDSEDNSEFNILTNKVHNVLENSSIRVRLLKNTKKLGGFKNKYYAISETNNKFVYQIDSDNIANNKFLKFIGKADERVFDKEILYLPSKIHLFKDSKYESLYKPSNRVIFSKKSKIITPEYLKNALNMGINFVKHKNVNWFLNIGNPFFYKDSYLTNLEKGLASSEKELSACSIALCYFWVSSGKNICMSSFLNHYHRQHKDSYWITAGQNAPNSVEYFRNQIKNL
jgi:glycosyltransferase involved in cell wall biosynthesis